MSRLSAKKGKSKAINLSLQDEDDSISEAAEPDRLNESMLSDVSEEENSNYFKSKLIYQKRALLRKNLTL